MSCKHFYTNENAVNAGNARSTTARISRTFHFTFLPHDGTFYRVVALGISALPELLLFSRIAIYVEKGTNITGIISETRPSRENYGFHSKRELWINQLPRFWMVTSTGIVTFFARIFAPYDTVYLLVLIFIANAPWQGTAGVLNSSKNFCSNNRVSICVNTFKNAGRIYLGVIRLENWPIYDISYLP